MPSEEQLKQDWLTLLEKKRKYFNELGIFSWTDGIKWRTEFGGHEFPPFELFRGGLRGLRYLLLYLAEMYCYAVSAESIAKDLENEGDEAMAGFWRYEVRNYHFYDFVPRYFSFLDHAAYFVASLAKWKLVPPEDPRTGKPGKIYYGTFVPLLKDSLSESQRVGYLDQGDRELFLEFLKN